MTESTSWKSTLKKPTTIAIAAGLIIILAVASYAIASQVLWVPGTNSIEGTPITPSPVPTATPTPTPTASPTPIPEPTITTATLTANDTLDGEYIFFRGDVLDITATCNGTGIRDIQLYNKDVYLETKQTDTSGIVHFYRTVNNPYNYTVQVYNEIP